MSREDQTSKRSESVRVRLESEMMQRLAKVAADFGMSPSTLAAFAVANFVREQERTVVLDRIMTEDGVIVASKKTEC